MIHFAYPNVIPRESKFLGCGRYVAALLGEAPDENYKLVELNIPNITEVHLAALQLAPEAVDSKKVIYERRDTSSQLYLGESRDLAYILALIIRTRSIKFFADRIHGDIWCTGCIDIKGESRPFLKAVDVSGFSWKLEAFLSGENPDRLFLVPAQNVLPTHEVLFQKSDVNVVSLKQFQQNLSTVQDIFAKKAIVKIQGDELEHLVNVLFETPELKQKALHPVIGINPYRGLFAFQEQDAEFFFGRELYTKLLVEAVRNKPFVAVIGPSGIGKSSVVNAGLIPQLRRQIPSWEGQKRVNWLIAMFRPGADPFRTLSSALLPLLEPEKSEVEQLVESKRMT